MTTDQQYQQYLTDHINNVKKGFRFLQNHLPELFIDNSVDYTFDVDHNVRFHDNSKYDFEEWSPYRDYFYGERTVEVEEQFDYAWLQHIHNNPHHWQHWILIEDDSKEPRCLEIPYDYLMEMILDWWAFSWKQGNLYEIFDWYKKHDNIKMNEISKKKVENILNKIKEFLDANPSLSKL